jgi:AraC family transcriptional regulator, regulatory protein of adaptative response / DNA-3-methyladenine glycosylase II
MIQPMLPSANQPQTDTGQYLALKARDARFDGRFFTGVTSTGIYCRPVCKVRTPKQENCRFYALASQAEAAGFRPCMRCRPELAPSALLADQGVHWSLQDASAILARQAVQLLDTTQQWTSTTPSMGQVAERLGVSERHMRRIFEAHWGVSPLQYLQTRRLLTAKQLLTDTRLPVAQVAMLSGFDSVRRFNSVFASQYRLQPRALRKATSTLNPNSSLQLKAAFRPPLDGTALLQFFATRSLAGIEQVDMAQHTLSRTLAVDWAGTQHTGWVQLQIDEARCEVRVQVSDSLAQALPLVMARIRALLDLDADPNAIHAVLHSSFPNSAGLRVPGTLDGFELAVRAVLGQQITVQAARTLGARLVQRLGVPLETPVVGLTHLFPTPQALRKATDEELGQLGIVRQRQQAIRAVAGAVADELLQLNPSADVARTVAALESLPGFGPWTAQYIAMRALRWPDAFPAGDVALQKALGVRDAKHPAQAARAAELASHAWQPWRSYATVRAWSGDYAEDSPHNA